MLNMWAQMAYNRFTSNTSRTGVQDLFEKKTNEPPSLKMNPLTKKVNPLGFWVFTFLSKYTPEYK